eukprot:TRINITY_DN4080_c0_g1_i1.p2 TRINITY_DN4080_c0_g1~~TRINITY_DN4080_c0_g1_i1.p2  ORF type:complete len:195 (+),score=46.64 TRINITY_DN4080_c0_g1_i1:97-681(+)
MDLNSASSPARKPTSGGLMMLGSGSPSQRPASGSVMLLPSKVQQAATLKPEQNETSEQIVVPALEASPKPSEEKKKHKKKKKGKKVEGDALLSVHEPGNTPIFVDDVETKPSGDESLDPRILDTSNSAKPLPMLSGGKVPKKDGSVVSPSSSSLLAQGEIAEPKPKILPLYEVETGLEFADDAGASVDHSSFRA